MALMNMFWVYKDFFRSRGTQCILNQGRTTHKKTSRFKVDNYGFFQIRAKSNQNRIRNFYFSAFFEGVC